MRTFSVEEQLLMVGDTTLAPLPAEVWPETGQEVAAPPGHEVTMEPGREQIVVVGPPQTTLQETLETIRTGRAAAERATLEVGIADVCLEPADAAVIAALTRALVESTARNWRAQAPEVSASALEGWAWLASRSGVEGQLIDPTHRAAVPASVVVDRLLDVVRPVLSEYGEAESIEAGVADILRRGSGARRQREACARRHEVRDIVAAAVDFTRSEPAESSGAAPSGVAPSGEAPADDPYWTAKSDWWKPPNGHDAPLQLHGLNHTGRQ